MIVLRGEREVPLSNFWFNDCMRLARTYRNLLRPSSFFQTKPSDKKPTSKVWCKQKLSFLLHRGILLKNSTSYLPMLSFHEDELFIFYENHQPLIASCKSLIGLLWFANECISEIIIMDRSGCSRNSPKGKIRSNPKPSAISTSEIFFQMCAKQTFFPARWKFNFKRKPGWTIGPLWSW